MGINNTSPIASGIGVTIPPQPSQRVEPTRPRQFRSDPDEEAKDLFVKMFFVGLGVSVLVGATAGLLGRSRAERSSTGMTPEIEAELREREIAEGRYEGSSERSWARQAVDGVGGLLRGVGEFFGVVRPRPAPEAARPANLFEAPEAVRPAAPQPRPAEPVRRRELMYCRTDNPVLVVEPRPGPASVPFDTRQPGEGSRAGSGGSQATGGSAL